MPFGWHLCLITALLSPPSLDFSEEPPPPVPAQQQPTQLPEELPPLSPALPPPQPEPPQSPPLAQTPLPVCEPTLPINLPTALRLADVRPIDVAVASERIRVAAAQLQRAEVLWLPTILMGTDYFRHDGQIQDVQGNIIGTSKTSFMVGAAPYAVFAVTDAIFAPLAARQDVRARDALLQATKNDTLLAVAEAYFNVQQARGELLGALDATRRAEDLARRTAELAPGLVPQVEAVRARAELARRRQAVFAAQGRWKTASAELARILRMDAAALLGPLEPPHLQITLVDLKQPVDALIPIALTNRPELASQQAVVQATLQRLRQEKLRPLIPSVLLRGASTNPAGTLAGGYFGGGLNGTMSNFSWRGDWDLQFLWELQNLGFGNRARVNERKAENQVALMELFRLQDRVAAEVAQAHAQGQAAADRVREAESGLKDAIDSVDKNFQGMSQTRRLGGNVILLVVRPQEAVASVQTLAQAYLDYYGAVADYDRAQFRLYRALGHSAPCLPIPEEPAGEAPVVHPQ